jgi:uncharacterized protein (DUF4415 family)
MKKKLIPVNDTNEIPAFKSETEEAEFWSTHSFGPKLLEQMKPLPEGLLPPPRDERTKPIAVRFDRDVLKRLKAVAAHKGKGYQTMLKEFVLERLYEEEKRDKIIG